MLLEQAMQVALQNVQREGKAWIVVYDPNFQTGRRKRYVRHRCDDWKYRHLVLPDKGATGKQIPLWRIERNRTVRIRDWR